jgi:glutamate synthase domain-containing protein 1
MVFLPRDARQSALLRTRVFERIIREEGQKVLGWRTVPTDNSMIGATAKATEPVFRQCFHWPEPAYCGRPGKPVEPPAARSFTKAC